MIEVYNKALDSSIKVDRILGKIEGAKPGPTVVFFGGIHGNETSGICALKNVFETIKQSNISATRPNDCLCERQKKRLLI